MKKTIYFWESYWKLYEYEQEIVDEYKEYITQLQ